LDGNPFSKFDKNVGLSYYKCFDPNDSMLLGDAIKLDATPGYLFERSSKELMP